MLRGINSIKIILCIFKESLSSSVMITTLWPRLFTTSEGELSIFACGARQIVKYIICVINRALKTIGKKEYILAIMSSISQAEFQHAINNMSTRSDASLQDERGHFHHFP